MDLILDKRYMEMNLRCCGIIGFLSSHQRLMEITQYENKHLQSLKFYIEIEREMIDIDRQTDR